MRKFCGLVIFTIPLMGCRPTESGYPEVQVSSPVGTSQICHQCGKKIATVSAEHQMGLGAASYIVCSDACKKKQQTWHESQFGK